MSDGNQNPPLACGINAMIWHRSLDDESAKGAARNDHELKLNVALEI